MTTQDDGRTRSAGHAVEPTTLRERAEEKARAAGDQDLEALWPEEARRLLHELRVRQIELEMQNEELRRSQQELEASRARYFDLYDLAPVGYLTLSEPGLILEGNLTAAGLLGVARSALVNQPLAQFILPEDQHIYYRHRDQLLETGESQVCEVRMVRRSQGGSPFWARLEATAARGNESGAPPNQCRVVLSDITQHRQAEEELRSSRDKLQAIIDLLPGYVAYLDPDLNVLQLSRALADWWGLSREQAVSKNLKEVTRPGGYERTAPYYRQAMAERRTVFHEFPSVSARGQAILARSVAVPRLDEQGNMLGIAVQIQDVTEQRRAEEELRTQRQQLEIIIDSVPAYITYMDPELNILHVNRALAEWWGYSKEQVVGKSYKEVARPEAYERNVPYLRQAMASRQTVTYERQQVSARGRTVVAWTSSVPHLDEQGNVQGFVVLVLDVTEERQAESVLRSQRQLLDIVIDSVPAYILYMDSDLNILHASRNQAEWLGYTKETIAGKNYKDVARPGSWEINAPYLRQALASRQAVTHELQSVGAAGQIARARVTSAPHLDEQGNVQGLVALSLDITEQRRAEDALRASEERYRLLVENMREGVAVLDEHGLLTYVNDSLCAMTGWARDELLDQPSVKLYAAEDQAEHLGWLARRRAGLSDTYESVLQRRGGGTVPVLVSASPILDSQGKYKGGLAVLTDITERVAAERALRRRVEELSMLNHIAHTMAAAAELPTTLTQASEIIAGLFTAHCVHIIWPDGEETGVHRHVGSERGPRQAGPTRFNVSVDELAVLGRVMRVGRSQVVEDVRSLPLSDPERELLVHRQVRSTMFIPLMIGGTAVGLLWIASDQPGRVFTADEVRLAETIALDLAATIESARVSRHAQAAAAAEERSRLARDLHDAATQTIYSAVLIAEALPRVWADNPAEGQRNLVKLRQLVRGALAEMRTLLFELRPWTLEAVELSKLLEYLGNALTGRTGIPVEWDIRGEHKLSADTTLALYRIAQEALNNIDKHAEPTRVRVTLQRGAEQGMLCIEDDGHGFDPASVGSDKMGLQIMRERAQAIGAKLTVESALGRGTTVAVVWKEDEGRRTKDEE